MYSEHVNDVDQLAIDLLVLSARFTRLAARESTATMPRALWRTLAQLDELGPVRVSDLAAATHISQPTATSLLQRLGERGWVERGSDPDDARAVRVRVTDAGRQALAGNRAAAAAAMAPRLARLDDESRQALSDGLSALRLVLQDADDDRDDAAGHTPPRSEPRSATSPTMENA